MRKLLIVAALALVVATGVVTAQFNWNLEAPTTSPTVRDFHAMSHDTFTGSTLLFGGRDGATVLGDTWIWNGATWVQLLPTTSPTPRRGASMVFDVARGVHVLFGGLDSASMPLSDLWEFNGTTWTQIGIAGPAARWYAPMAYDSLRFKVRVAFGNGSPGFGPADVWDYDGIAGTWTLVPTTGTPTARAGAQMTYDAGLDRFVMVGAEHPLTGFPLNDPVWILNAATSAWSAGASPGVNLAHPALAYDVGRQRVVCFGGNFVGNLLNMTFELSGATWTQVMPMTSPSARRQAALVYEPNDGTCFLFGGVAQSFGAAANDSWTYASTTGPATYPGNGADAAIEVSLSGAVVPTGNGVLTVNPSDLISYRFHSPLGMLASQGFALVATGFATGNPPPGIKLLASDPANNVWINPFSAVVPLNGLGAPVNPFFPALLPGGFLYGPFAVPPGLTGVGFSTIMQLIANAPGLNPVNLGLSNAIELQFL